MSGDRFGRNVRKLRLARGMTLRDLSKASGYARSTLCEIEKSKRLPSLYRLPRLANALKVSMGALFEGVR